MNATRTILVVDDDEIARSVAAHILREAGLNVLEAGGGSEASELIEQFGPGIQLMLTDIQMPVMNGWALAEQVRGRRPDLTIVFTSGSASKLTYAQKAQEQGASFVPKPFRPQQLTDTIQRALSQAR